MRRRTFLASTASLAACAVACRPQWSWGASPSENRRIYTTLKIGMVQVPGGLKEKFEAVKEAGFDGIELDSPGFDVEEALAAIKATGLPVDGTVGSTHWNIRHTSPDAEQRQRAIDHLKQAIRDTHAVGGSTTLLVAGSGPDGEEAELIERSVENISKAIPLAAELGVIIAIENVWNRFLYDHEGGRDQTADALAAYVDAFQSPWVAMQFDIGNHWKYGDPAQWIRTLGKRIVKLDAKSYSREKENWAQTITDGDIRWDEVRQALEDIGFAGWAAAEVGGGDQQRLTEISRDMNVAFGIT